MFHLSDQVRITVTVGGEARTYLGFVTTAPPELDFPKTVSVEEGSRMDILGLAVEPITHDALHAGTSARLVLIETGDRGWQRSTYRGHHHVVLSADWRLVGLDKLQSCLWQRLERHVARPMAA